MNKLEKQPPSQRGEDVPCSRDNRKLHRALNRLLFKIDAEAARGTPLHPAGYPDHTWDVGRNPGYPAEFTRARGVLRRLGISHELIEGGEAFQNCWNEYRKSESAQ